MRLKAIQDDDYWMTLALAQARLAADYGEVPIGAVLVKEGRLLAAGHNLTISAHDPSAHAEVVVMRRAGVAVGNHRLIKSTLYVTLEPCVMCVGALLQARIQRLVFGAYDKRAGACGSLFELHHHTALNHRVEEYKGGVREAECRECLQNFFRKRR